MLRDRLAHRLTLLRVRDGFPQRLARDADAARGDIHAANLQAIRRLIEALPFLAADEAEFRIALEAGKADLARIDAAIAKLWKFAAAFDAWDFLARLHIARRRD